MSETAIAPTPATSLSAVKPPAGVTVDDFRDAMRELAGGVAVITVGTYPDVSGFTATSVTSLSAEPPRVIVSVTQASSSFPLLQKNKKFGVNMLAQYDVELADRFAGKGGLKGPQRYQGAEWTTLTTGTLLLQHALAALDCEIEEMLPRYDHCIIIGRVVGLRVRSDCKPLVYWHSQYHRFGIPATERESAVVPPAVSTQPERRKG